MVWQLRVGAGMFSFSVKWLCAPAGQSAGLVFSLRVRALVARGEFYFMVKWLCAPRGQGGCFESPSLPLDSTLPERVLLALNNSKDEVEAQKC